MLTLGSFFDGVGTWQLSASKFDIKPVWCSEIDEFPAAVSKHHFPNTKQLGDITKLTVDDLEPVNIICAGSPCQDLSVAGKRAGLAGERSGLFVDSIKLVHGLRKQTGSPRYFVWENVPGAFSSNKGHDFRAVLEEITKTEIPMPKDGRWAESGYVEWGGTSSLAWRTLDAQYWGVPQRRKRIFLVADFGGRTAREILFIEQGMCGYSSESQGTREETTADVGTSVNNTSNGVTYVGFYPQMKAESMTPMVEKSPCLVNGTNPGFQNGVYCVGNEQVTKTKLMDIQKTVGALQSSYYKGERNGGEGLVPQNKVVRRLTPLECERLMGLPDGYTDIEFNGKPAPDSKRYKAIGNGMAVPNSDFIMKRISEVLNAKA